MTEADRAKATGIIHCCERDLGRKLSRGEMRDLLMDNTEWKRDRVVGVVASLFPERPSNPPYTGWPDGKGGRVMEPFGSFDTHPLRGPIDDA